VRSKVNDEPTFYFGSAREIDLDIAQLKKLWSQVLKISMPHIVCAGKTRRPEKCDQSIWSWIMAPISPLQFYQVQKHEKLSHGTAGNWMPPGVQHRYYCCVSGNPQTCNFRLIGVMLHIHLHAVGNFLISSRHFNNYTSQLAHETPPFNYKLT